MGTSMASVTTRAPTINAKAAMAKTDAMDLFGSSAIMMSADKSERGIKIAIGTARFRIAVWPISRNVWG